MIHICDSYTCFYSLDTATLRDITESNLDVRISELEEFLRKSYDSNDIYNCENHDFDHDDTITSDRNSYRARAPFLHDSNYSLSSQDRFTAYEDDDQENDQLTSGLPVRSNSLRIIPLNTNSALLDKAPKKVVRFADVLVSIKYYVNMQCRQYLCLNEIRFDNECRFCLLLKQNTYTSISL